MLHQNNPLKTPDLNSGVARILTERLRELDINTTGLPPHVMAHLRATVDEEAARIQRTLAEEVFALQRRAEERIKKQVERTITFKTVGKAFGTAASTATGGAAK